MRLKNFSGILRHKQITWSQPDDQVLGASTKNLKKKKKKGICRRIYFAILADHIVKLKES